MAELEPSAAAPDVVSLLDGEFSCELAGLQNCKELYRKTVEHQKSLRARIFRANAEAPSQAEQALHEAQSAAESLTRIRADFKALDESIRRQGEDAASPATLTELSELLKPVATVNKYRAYLSWIDAVDKLSLKIKSSLLAESPQHATEHFSLLVSLLNNLCQSKCVHLVQYVEDIVIHWHRLIKLHLSSKLDKLLREASWPRVTAVMKDAQTPKSEDHGAQLELVVKLLLAIQLPPLLIGHQARSAQRQQLPLVLGSLPNWLPPLLPIELLVEPLRKRFKFHFSGKKQTNDPTKPEWYRLLQPEWYRLLQPEWYLTQVLHWVRDNCDYLVSTIQPLLRANGHPTADVQVEFTRAMVQLVLEKVAADLPELVYDDHVFAHLVDELLAFDGELRDVYDYPPSAPSCLHVLATEEPLKKWLSIEKKFAVERIDSMLSSPTAWMPQCTATDVGDEQTKVPECADGFIALMTTLTGRYRSLPYVVCRLMFLDLQLELLDDVRVRLLQIMKHELSAGGSSSSKGSPLTASFCAPLNALRCLADAVAEWNELPSFVQLQYYKEKYGGHANGGGNWKSLLSKDGFGMELAGDRNSVEAAAGGGSGDGGVVAEIGHASVFDETLRLYAHVERDMLAALVHHASTDVRAKGRHYADNSRSTWTTAPSKKDVAFVGLSASACGMLAILQDHLHSAHVLLARQAFACFWRQLAEELDSFIFAKVVGDNYFNDGGAAQFHFDMTRNLFPIFGKYTPKPENFFKRSKEAAILLTMLPGTAILLKDILKRALHSIHSQPAGVQDPVAAVQEHGVYRLTPEECELVLSRRLDIVPS